MPARDFDLALNLRRAAADAPYPDRFRSILSLDALAQARAEITRWPGYAPTPLRRLDGLARSLGVDRLWYKDEATRFSLDSFKALGGAYAVLRLLKGEIVRRQPASAPSTEDLLAGHYAALTRDLVVTCATDGNHGRSVAWGASMFGCRCIIYVHEHVSEGRKQAIATYGAEIVTVPGTYDDAIRQAAQDADRHGRFVVSDTSYEGYTEVPRDVMQGYALMVEEALDQLADEPPPTHVVVPGGVGGVAAAVFATLWERCGSARPYALVAEPTRAACLLASLRAGHRVALDGDTTTVMAGLACGEPSLIAWPILEAAAHAIIAVPDEAVPEQMRRLATGVDGDWPIVAGESAVAGLAALSAVLDDPAAAESLALDPSARLLIFGTEGATDPTLYESLVGRSPEAVVGRQ